MLLNGGGSIGCLRQNFRRCGTFAGLCHSGEFFRQPVLFLDSLVQLAVLGRNNPVIVEDACQEQHQNQANAKSKQEIMEITLFLGNVLFHLILGAQFVKAGVDFHIIYTVVRRNDFVQQTKRFIIAPRPCQYLHLYLTHGIEVESRFLNLYYGTVDNGKCRAVISPRLQYQRLCPQQFEYRHAVVDATFKFGEVYARLVIFFNIYIGVHQCHIKISPSFGLHPAGGFLEAGDGFFIFGHQLQQLVIACLCTKRHAQEGIGLRQDIIVTGNFPQQADALPEAIFFLFRSLLQVIDDAGGIECGCHSCLVLTLPGTGIHFPGFGGRQFIVSFQVVGGDKLHVYLIIEFPQVVPDIKVEIGGRLFYDFVVLAPVYIGDNPIAVHHSLHLCVALPDGFGFRLLKQRHQRIHLLVIAGFCHIDVVQFVVSLQLINAFRMFEGMT